MEKDKIAGPFYPSTMSLQSRQSQQLAEQDLLPTEEDKQTELEDQLTAVENIAGR